MPANLPPEYFEAEKKFKQASTIAEKLSALEDLIASVPKHKGTDKLRADLRRRASQLNKEAIALRKTKKGGRDSLYNIQKEGAAQVALVGFPNSGKSSILASLTNAVPVIADYPLTTLLPLPGMMPFENVQIQLVDLPAIGNESTDGWVSGILRNTDAFLVVLDLADEPEMQMELILDQLGRWNIHAAARGSGAQGGIRKRALIAANKSDLPGAGDSLRALLERWGGTFPVVPLSVRRKENLEELKRAIFDVAGIIRIYSKPPGKEPNMAMPFTIQAGCTVIAFAEHIHKDFLNKLKFARIWGSAKFDGQKVERGYVLKDRDIVELHT
jgi:ribosome-interacting GTPase 1